MLKRGVSSNFSYQKRGQVTVFIIIAILIVAIALVLFFLTPNLRTGTSGFDETNPQAFMQSCLEDRIQEVVGIISSQGGVVTSGNYFTYNDVNIEYLCYTNQNYETCVVQEPLLKQSIESGVKEEIAPDVESCLNALQESYSDRNYEPSLERGITKVDLLPKRVVVSLENYILTTSRNGESQRFDGFNIVLNNNLYELIGIVESIVDWETTLGDADPRIYMTYYPDLKVEKNVRDEGTKIYIVTDRNSGNKFQFASRSLVFPPGH